MHAAGEANITGSAAQSYRGIDINRKTGHYRATSESLNRALGVFARYGIFFVGKGIDYDSI